MLKPGLSNNSYDFAAQINPDPALILRTLHAATTVTADQLVGCVPGQLIKVSAQALPGPGGVLTAPLSGAPCVWYRSAFFPGQGHMALPSFAPSDTTPLQAQINNVAHRVMNPSEEISTAPFLIGQPGGLQLLVDPLVADVDTDVLVANHEWRSEHGFAHGLMVEWIVPPGARVLALGRVGADHTMVTDQAAALLISTKDEQRIISRDQSPAASTAHALGRFTVKLGRFNKRSGHWLRVFLVVLSVLTVCVVLGALVAVHL